MMPSGYIFKNVTKTGKCRFLLPLVHEKTGVTGIKILFY